MGHPAHGTAEMVVRTAGRERSKRRKGWVKKLVES